MTYQANPRRFRPRDWRYSLRLDGGANISVAHDDKIGADLVASGATWLAWIYIRRLPSQTGVSQRYIAYEGATPNTRFVELFGGNPANNILMRICDGVTNTIIASSGSALLKRGWNLVGMIWNSDRTASIILNDSIVASSLTAFDAEPNGNPLVLGAFSRAGASQTDALIARAEIFEGAMTAEEVDAYYYDGIEPPYGKALFLPLVEMHGTPADQSGNALTVSLNNSPTWKAKSILGERSLLREFTYALKHTASGQVELGTDDFDFERTDTFSYGGWVYIENYSTSAILGRRDSTGNFRGHELIAQSDGTIRMVLQNASGNRIQVTAPYIIPKKKWVHIFVTYDGSSTAAGAKIYVNGRKVEALVNSDTLSQTIVQASINASIGSRNNTGVRWEGFISKIDVFDIELTAGQVYDLYKYGAKPRENLYAEFEYKTGSGATLFDTSGNGRDGTINALTWSDKTPFKNRGLNSDRVLVSSRTLI